MNIVITTGRDCGRPRGSIRRERPKVFLIFAFDAAILKEKSLQIPPLG